jgi:uncharacterized protein YjbI with pentapeptide repeats
MSEQTDQRLASPPRPSGNDRQAWQGYWRQIGQPWRTEPEIDTKRQEQLAASRSTAPDIEQGIYPFKGMQLSRADVEWLLATHEHGRGPVDWSDESQREREGLDVRGADLRNVDLSHLPLARLRGGNMVSEVRTVEQLSVAALHLEGAILRETHLEGVMLRHAYLDHANLHGAHLEEALLVGIHAEGIELYEAHLERARLSRANLQSADLVRSHLERADLRWANLDDADLSEAHLEEARLNRALLNRVTALEDTVLGNKERAYVSLADVQWGDANLTVVKWSQVDMLGDEQEARQRRRNGEVKDAAMRLREFETAARANQQLANVLQAQGVNEDAKRFAYRAQKLQRIVLRRQKKFGPYLFSLFLDGVAGYGYRPQRCLYVYVLALIGFTLAHYIVGVLAGPHLTWLSALAVSVQSLHGRIFSFQPSDPQTLLNTIEAFVGLFIEAIVVAVITQRILGK